MHVPLYPYHYMCDHVKLNIFVAIIDFNFAKIKEQDELLPKTNIITLALQFKDQVHVGGHG